MISFVVLPLLYVDTCYERCNHSNRNQRHIKIQMLPDWGGEVCRIQLTTNVRKKSLEDKKKPQTHTHIARTTTRKKANPACTGFSVCSHWIFLFTILWCVSCNTRRIHFEYIGYSRKFVLYMLVWWNWKVISTTRMKILQKKWNMCIINIEHNTKKERERE